MTNEAQTKSHATHSVQLNELFGPTPVLSSESIDAYRLVMARLMECFKPEDFMVELFVKDLADATWECLRYTRHKKLAIERNFCQQLEAQMKQQKEREAKKQAETVLQMDTPDAPITRELVMNDVEFLLCAMEGAANERRKQTPTDVEHADALEGKFDYYERLDRGHCIAMARRNDIIEQITLYRKGLAHQLRRVSDQIIDGEFSETKRENTGLIRPSK
jgi:hypothetical protein